MSDDTTDPAGRPGQDSGLSFFARARKAFEAFPDMQPGEFAFFCTGRGAHDRAECELTVPPAGVAPRRGRGPKVPPMFRGSRLRLASHFEVRCPVCDRNWRAGSGKWQDVIGAEAAGLAGIDISLIEH